jgi:CelD/BcsL family acetyltransferase involved in cellulose biosynthesis
VFRMERPQVFYTYQWALAVSRAYQSLTPLIWLGYEAERLVGVAALAESLQQPKQAFFLCGATADYCDFICAPADAAAFCQQVLNDLKARSFTGITLANIPKDSPAVNALTARTRGFGYHVYSRTAYHCAQVVLGENTQRERVRASVEKRQAVKRQIASMSKLGAVSTSHDRDSKLVTDALPDFFRMHVARFLAMGRTSNLVNRERRVFLRELSRLLAENGWLANSRLIVGNRPVAFNFGFRFAGTWFWYQPTFLHEMTKNSPGLCLLSKMVADACETPDIDVVDLGLGAEEYKERFANASRETLHITLHASPVAHFKEALRYRSAKIATRSGAVESFLRRQRERIASTRHRRLLPAGKKVLRRIWRRAFSEDEVLFYRWGVSAPPDHVLFQLRPVQIEDLAEASMLYCDDPQTQAYLLRAARRLRSGEARGFVLLAPNQIPVHFCWITNFDGFHVAELDQVLSSEQPDRQLIFDCWTPGSERGNRYYPRALSMLAEQLSVSGSAPWIFSASENWLSRRGILTAGFEFQFSLIRKRWFFKRCLSRSSSGTAASALEPAVFAA